MQKESERELEREARNKMNDNTTKEREEEMEILCCECTVHSTELKIVWVFFIEKREREKKERKERASDWYVSTHSMIKNRVSWLLSVLYFPFSAALVTSFRDNADKARGGAERESQVFRSPAEKAIKVYPFISPFFFNSLTHSLCVSLSLSLSLSVFHRPLLSPFIHYFPYVYFFYIYIYIYI